MRNAALLGACAALVGLGLGFTLFSESSAHAARPALRVVRSAPLTVRGSSFRSHERVRVTAGAGTTSVKARESGTFVITIRGATPCDVTRVVAVGSAGSYAVVKMLAPRMCMPARSH